MGSHSSRTLCFNHEVFVNNLIVYLKHPRKIPSMTTPPTTSLLTVDNKSKLRNEKEYQVSIGKYLGQSKQSIVLRSEKEKTSCLRYR